MNDSSKFASIQTAIWWNHDNKNYAGVEKNAFDLLVLLGYNMQLSKSVSKHIRKAYFFYDKAEQNKKKREYFFTKMNGCNIKIGIILGINKRLPVYYGKWWICFMKHKYLKVAYYLLVYHFFGFKNLRKIVAPILCGLFILAGLFGHNKKNKKMNIFFLEIYWAIIIRLDIKYFVIY